MRFIFFHLVLLLASGCSILGQDSNAPDLQPGKLQVFEGFYSWGFEQSMFTACDIDENWWLIWTDIESEAGQMLHDRYRELINDQFYTPVYVRIRGVISHRGEYGHLGAYQREITLLELIEIRETKDSDC